MKERAGVVPFIIKVENVLDVIKKESNDSVNEEGNDPFPEESNNQVPEESTVTINEGSWHPHPVDFVMEELESSVIPVTKKRPYKRKMPRRKSRRKLFRRSKRRGERLKKELSVLTPEVIVKEEESLLMEPEEFTSNYDPKVDEPTSNVESAGTTTQETLKHSSVFIVKQEPPSSIDDSVVKLPVQNPIVKVRKVLLHRNINKAGITVFTPVLSPNVNPVLAKAIQVPISKIQAMKPVSQNRIQKPLLTSCQPELVIVQPQIDHSYFIDELNCQETCMESTVSMDEPMIYVPKNIPVASYTTTTLCGENSTVPHMTQPGNIPTVSHMGKPGNIPTLSRVDQPGNIPALALLAQPANIPAIPLMAQPRNIPANTLVSQSGNIPTVSQQIPSRNIPVESQIPTTSRATFFNGVPGPNITSLSTKVLQPKVESSTEQLLEIVGKKLIETIPTPWITVLRTNGIALCLLNQADIVTIRRSMLIEATGKITVGVHGKELPPNNPFWTLVITTELRPDNIEEFITKVHRNFVLLRGMEVCRAVEEFQPFWKNMENCEIDQNRFHEIRFDMCCRSTSCQLLVPNVRNKRCTECSKVWKTLSRRSVVDAKKPESLSQHKPFKYLTSPEKRERFERAVKDIKKLRLMNKRLTEKLNQVLHPEVGVPADSLVADDFSDDAEVSNGNSENVL